MKIVLLVAYDLEIKPIVTHFHLEKPKKIRYTKIWHHSKFNLVQCGIGKVNAAASTQLVIDYMHPDLIINIGLCGGFARAMRVGEVVLPSSVIQYDNDLTVFGREPGYIPGIGKVRLLLHRISKITNKYKSGVCITGDRILQGVSDAMRMYTLFSPTVVDMELGAIAQVCYLNNTKICAIKCPTDTVENSDIKNFKRNATRCMKNVIAALDEILQRLSQ